MVEGLDDKLDSFDQQIAAAQYTNQSGPDKESAAFTHSLGLVNAAIKHLNQEQRDQHHLEHPGLGTSM